MAADWSVDASIERDGVLVCYGAANERGKCRRVAKLTASMAELGVASWYPERVPVIVQLISLS